MKQRKGARKTGRTSRKAKAVAPARKVVRPLALPAECVIATAGSLRSELLRRLTDARAVQIDAKRVERIDTATLQVLAAFARDRRVEGLSVEWLGVPASLTHAAALLDLTDALGLGSPSVDAVPA